MIRSDWHIHSEFSYDSKLPISDILSETEKLGFEKVGITDHVNYNESCYLDVVPAVAGALSSLKEQNPELQKKIVLGVELTPINKPEFDYLAKYKTREGFTPALSEKPLDIELAMSKEEMLSHGVRYAVCAAHWRADVADKNAPASKDELIREWHRQQMWLAVDERTTVLGHPWYHGRGVWYDDFSVIPRSMHNEFAAALLENNKYLECNYGVICAYNSTEKFRNQYAEYLREMFECGIKITYGSDSHNRYNPDVKKAEEYLARAGFKDGDVTEIREEDLW